MLTGTLTNLVIAEMTMVCERSTPPTSTKKNRCGSKSQRFFCFFEYTLRYTVYFPMIFKMAVSLYDAMRSRSPILEWP